MTDTELKEFGEAFDRLRFVYVGETIDLCLTDSMDRTRSCSASVGIGDARFFGSGPTPMRAVDDLMSRYPNSRAVRLKLADVINGEMEKLSMRAAQLEAQSV